MTGYTDIHAHIVPGVDDGSPSLEVTARMLEKEYLDGVRTIYATSHFRKDMFEAPLADYQQQFEKVRALGAEIGITVLPGCEFHACMDMVEMLDHHERPCLGDSRHVLVEFRRSAEKDYIRERCYDLLSHGYQPVMAHFERCDVCREDREFTAFLVRMGVKLQMNSESLTGDAGLMVKRFCRDMVRKDLVHFLATDCHNMGYRKPNMAAAAAALAELRGSQYAEEILIHHPQQISRAL